MFYLKYTVLGYNCPVLFHYDLRSLEWSLESCFGFIIVVSWHHRWPMRSPTPVYALIKLLLRNRSRLSHMSQCVTNSRRALSAFVRVRVTWSRDSKVAASSSFIYALIYDCYFSLRHLLWFEYSPLYCSDFVLSISLVVFNGWQNPIFLTE
jgi:hypothetical protein